MQTHHDHSTAGATIGGTILTLFATIDLQDYFKTILLAFIGALVSFLVSKLLHWIWDLIRKK